jgi:hypothetical protein
MNSFCDFCLRDSRRCKFSGDCDYIPKYNLCPICKELTVVHEPICHKCGYAFKSKK